MDSVTKFSVLMTLFVLSFSNNVAAQNNGNNLGNHHQEIVVSITSGDRITIQAPKSNVPIFVMVSITGIVGPQNQVAPGLIVSNAFIKDSVTGLVRSNHPFQNVGTSVNNNDDAAFLDNSGSRVYVVIGPASFGEEGQTVIYVSFDSDVANTSGTCTISMWY